MRRSFLFALLLSLPAGTAFTQKHTQEFQMAFPETKVSNSLYNRIQLLDVRNDTTNMGVVHEGHLNRKETLVANPALRKQLCIILDELVDSATAQSGELLLRLQHFRISEITGGYSETGYCQLGAELLTKKGNDYQLLDTLNTTIKLVKGVDITAEILKAGSDRLTAFLTKNLTRTAGGKVYSYADVKNLDSFRKRNLLVYNVKNYTDGLYQSYDAFVAQTPDAKISADVKGDKLRRVWQVTPEGEKEEKPNPDKIYGVVFEGIPYIATEFGYYPMRKVKDDFIFEGRMRLGSDEAAQNASIMFGLAGYLLTKAATGGKTSDMYEMKIDFRSGRPLPLRQVE